MDQLYMPRIGDDKVKDKIIESLIYESSLTLRELGFKITKSSSVTYQAVYKSVQELIQKEILSKEDNLYKINKAWIEKLKNFTDKAESDTKSIQQSVEKGGIVKLSFNSQAAFGRFVLSFVSSLLDEKQKKDVLVNSWHVYNMLWLSEPELQKFKELKKFNIYLLSDKNTKVDHWLAKVWEEIGAKVNYGADNCKTSDFISVDDYVIQVHWNKQVKEDWEKQREKIELQDYNVLKGIQHIVASDKPMMCVIFKDPALAKEIKERTLT